jgi:TolB protein
LTALTGCTNRRAQVTFIGPTIEGVRQFHSVQADGKGLIGLFPKISGLGPFLEWSPDGKLAVVYSTADKAIYLADPTTGELQACLSCDLERAKVAAFSPQGDVVAVGDSQGLAIVKVDGSGSRRLTSIPSPDWMGWSPDGKRLALSAAGKQWRIYIVPVSEGTYTRLSDDVIGDAFAPEWSPDGNSIAFHLLDSDGYHLMMMSSDGSGVRKIVDWRTSLEIFDPGLAWPPQWSPDGKKIAFASLSSGGDSDIFTINVDGSGLVNLTNSPGQDLDPVWSPDGRSIAFESDREGNGEIFVMSSDGSKPINVSNLPQTDESQPKWRP